MQIKKKKPAPYTDWEQYIHQRAPPVDIHENMTLDEKIVHFEAKADKYLKRVRCCMWFFLITGVWFIGNALYSFHESRNWSRFIAVASGKLP